MNKKRVDILDCLSNLSNDEVFTSPFIANQMLDLLPEEIFKSSQTTFLDPCTKTGVFLREIVSRLLSNNEDSIPLQEKVNKILAHQIYGIPITELTYKLTKRTLYCSMSANGQYSIATCFNTPNGNILNKKYHHTFDKNNRCIYCGMNHQSVDSLEEYAYPFIHEKNLKEIYHMNFDVIIGNPPYQISDGGGTGDSAKPIYQLFIENAKKLNPKYIVMIVPSRYMKGGKGLDKFRTEMMEDKRIRYIYDFENAKEVFPEIDLDGGVNYFLWDRDYCGKCKYIYKSMDGKELISDRYLKNNLSSTIIRDPRQITIIEKVRKMKMSSFMSVVSSRNPYGFNADLFNDPQKYAEANLSLKEKKHGYKIYGIKGKKGGAKRIIGFVSDCLYIKNKNNINKYKLFFSKAYMTTSTVPPEIIVGDKNEIATETFLEIYPSDHKNEVLNCLKYIKTKFFRALLFFNRNSLNISKESFELVPLEDMKKEWTDKELYQKYGLDKQEVAFIEEQIKPME